jgi:hypothetical protein
LLSDDNQPDGPIRPILRPRRHLVMMLLAIGHNHAAVEEKKSGYYHASMRPKTDRQ